MITTILTSCPDVYEFRGLSTDTKPTNDFVGNGSTFLEMNTGKVYVYNAAETTAANRWIELQ